MNHITNASVKALSNWHVLPAVEGGVKLLHEQTSHLQGSIDVQVLIEGGNDSSGLAARVVKLRRRTILEFNDLCGLAEVNHQPDVL